MHNVFECDTFVYKNTMLEQFSDGAWSENVLSADILQHGYLFKPSTNLTYETFLSQSSCNKKYCITVIDSEGLMKSRINLDFSKAFDYITSSLDDVTHESYINIFDMSDATCFKDYMKTLSA
jgi:hypothetical protein